MKSMRNSPSTDCFSSESSNNSKNEIFNSDRKTQNYKHKLQGSNIKENKIANIKNTQLSNGLINFSKKLQEKSNIHQTNRCKSSTVLKKVGIKCPVNKIIEYDSNPRSTHTSKIGICKSNYSSRNINCSKSKINQYENDIDSEFLINNDYIESQNRRNELENNCLILGKEIRSRNEELYSLRDSVAENINENKKIILIQQRLEIQSNFMTNEIKKVKEELIKVNKELLKVLTEYSQNDEFFKGEEKIFSVKKLEMENLKSDLVKIEKYKKGLKEQIFIYRKEIEKIRKQNKNKYH